MNQNYIPQRGVDFDDFIGTIFFSEQKGLENVQFTPVYCPANDKHDDDFIGIRYSGYATKAKGKDAGKLVQGIAYPAKQFTAEDVAKLFDKIEGEGGVVAYRPKSTVTFDEVYIRVCYAQDADKEDNIKWVAGVDGGEVITLHGDRRRYTPRDAEQ